MVNRGRAGGFGGTPNAKLRSKCSTGGRSGVLDHDHALEGGGKSFNDHLIALLNFGLEDKTNCQVL